MTSPTQRSLKYMRDAGYLAEVTEHWNQWAGIRQDLFGFIDILCLGDDIVGVQTTTKSNMSARVNKIMDHANIAAVRKSGIRIEVHGWAKGKNGRWSVKVVDVS